MKPLLYLVHRLPYPPNKGDKLRSYHLLRFLAERYRVHLGAFIDNPADRAHAASAAALCASTFLPQINPRLATVASLRGMFGGEALSVAYYRSRAMQRWVERTIAAHAIERVVVFSGPMAQYVAGPRYARATRVVDFVDVDSEKWRQYGASMRWPWSWIYGREGRTLLEFEARTAAEFDKSTFVSRPEAEHFTRVAGVGGEKIAFCRNGVDVEYFDASSAFANPFAADELPLVFTGAMDYWPNVDAVAWFAENVLAEVRGSAPSARFYIVGSNPTRRVTALRGEHVAVTGSVPDVRPYLAHAAAVVVPLRIARGVQNKVLEALAMQRPVFALPAAAQGIEARDSAPLVVAEDAAALAREIAVHLTSAKYAGAGADGRAFVKRHYDWQTNLSAFVRYLEGAPADAAAQRA